MKRSCMCRVFFFFLLLPHNWSNPDDNNYVLYEKMSCISWHCLFSKTGIAGSLCVLFNVYTCSLCTYILLLYEPFHVWNSRRLATSVDFFLLCLNSFWAHYSCQVTSKPCSLFETLVLFLCLFCLLWCFEDWNPFNKRRKHYNNFGVFFVCRSINFIETLLWLFFVKQKSNHDSLEIPNWLYIFFLLNSAPWAQNTNQLVKITVKPVWGYFLFFRVKL